MTIPLSYPPPGSHRPWEVEPMPSGPESEPEVNGRHVGRHKRRSMVRVVKGVDQGLGETPGGDFHL